MLSLLTVSPMLAQEEQQVYDLLVRDNFNACTQSSPRYDRDDVVVWTYGYSGYVQMYSYNITEGYYDDTLTTADIPLESGNMYVLYVKPTSYMSSYGGKSTLTVSLGQGDDLSAYRELAKIDKVPYENYAEPAPTHEVSFVVEESGNYRLSFNAGPNSIYLKEAKLKNRGISPIPESPADFVVTADPDGALSVKVSFTMPTATLTGQPLESPAYNLYRGFQKIKNGVAAQPGEKVEISEKRGETGNVSYAVEIVSGENVSEKLTCETYVGPETPTAPVDAQLSLNGTRCIANWTAPTEGVHGVALLPEKLSYTVTRVLDGVETVVATDLADTSFAEDITPDGLQLLEYKVAAKYGPAAKTSEPASTPAIRIGSANLPFADSFAGAVISPMWDNLIVTGNSYGNYYWQAKDKMESRMITCQPYDADGGLLLYDSYSIQRNNSARLSTPPLACTEGGNIVLTFAMYHIASGTDVMKVQVSSDYGDWVDVPDAVFTPKGEPVGEWSVHTVQLGSSIAEGASTFRVGLLGESAYGQSVVIDAVKVFKLAEKDLAVAAFDVTSEVNAGTSAKLLLKIDNNSGNVIPSSDYTVEIISDFPETISIGELQDVPAIGSVMYTVDVPVTSGHIVNGADFSFAARVSCVGDTDPANDESESVDITVGYSAGASATELKRIGGENGEYVIEWAPAKDLAYEPVAMTESFEDAALAEHPNGPFNGWTQVDLDNAPGDTWYNVSGTEFMFVENVSTPGGLDGRNCIGVAVASNKQQDDWLISPEINCKEGSRMSLSMLLGLKQVSSWGNDYEVSLLYSTDAEFDILNPQTNFTQTVSSVKSTSYNDSKLPQDNKMHEVTFDGIPAEAKRVALHFTAKGKYSPAMWVDNIRITEIDECPLLGYRVYDADNGGCLNDQLIGASETTHTLRGVARESGAALGNIFVSAVYPDGEAEPSNTINVMVEAGIDDSLADPAAGEGMKELYDLNGLRIRKANVTPGIYIRRNGANTEKIIVR